jgi:hypothetical protein
MDHSVTGTARRPHPLRPGRASSPAGPPKGNPTAGQRPTRTRRATPAAPQRHWTHDLRTAPVGHINGSLRHRHRPQATPAERKPNRRRSPNVRAPNWPPGSLALVRHVHVPMRNPQALRRRHHRLHASPAERKPHRRAMPDSHASSNSRRPAAPSASRSPHGARWAHQWIIASQAPPAGHTRRGPAGHRALPSRRKETQPPAIAQRPRSELATGMSGSRSACQRADARSPGSSPPPPSSACQPRRKETPPPGNARLPCVEQLPPPRSAIGLPISARSPLGTSISHCVTGTVRRPHPPRPGRASSPTEPPAFAQLPALRFISPTNPGQRDCRK